MSLPEDHISIGKIEETMVNQALARKVDPWTANEQASLASNELLMYFNALKRDQGRDMLINYEGAVYLALDTSQALLQPDYGAPEELKPFLPAIQEAIRVLIQPGNPPAASH